MPGADRQVDRAHQLAAALAPDPGVMGEPEMAGGRIDEVDHRAVGLEQARGLVDGRDEQLVDVARTAVGVVAGVAGGGSCPGRPRVERARPVSAWSRPEDTTRP